LKKLIAWSALTAANRSGPAMTGSDVRRMAAATKQSVPAFIDSYLHIDHEEDYVFKETPVHSWMIRIFALYMNPDLKHAVNIRNRS
jgi:hypothetical protein